MTDCHETKSNHADWTLCLKCEHWVWPWPWLRSFKGKYRFCYVSAKNGTIATIGCALVYKLYLYVYSLYIQYDAWYLLGISRLIVSKLLMYEYFPWFIRGYWTPAQRNKHLSKWILTVILYPTGKIANKVKQSLCCRWKVTKSFRSPLSFSHNNSLLKSIEILTVNLLQVPQVRSNATDDSFIPRAMNWKHTSVSCHSSLKTQCILRR